MKEWVFKLGQQEHMQLHSSIYCLKKEPLPDCAGKKNPFNLLFEIKLNNVQRTHIKIHIGVIDTWSWVVCIKFHVDLSKIIFLT